MAGADLAHQGSAAGGALFRHSASDDAVYRDIPNAHPSIHPTFLAAAPASAANDACAPLLFLAGEWFATVAATLDASGELRVVAWVPPAEPAPMRRRRDLVDVRATQDADDLPHWRALFRAAGFSLDDCEDDEAEAPDDVDEVKEVSLDSIMAVRIAPTVQRVVFAEDVRPKAGPRPAIPVSVFDLAENPVEMRPGSPGRTFAPCKTTAQRIERLEGVIRCTSIVIQDTPEWLEREQQRRARQRPPRPPRGAKLRSKKLLALIGEQA